MDTKSLLPIGTLLHAGSYRIEKHLSSGGFGNTYLAHDIEMDRDVAIKEFFMNKVNHREGDSKTVSVSNANNLSVFDSQLNKFKKEARRINELSDKHIARVHSLFSENGTAYYVMDFIKGQSLHDKIKASGQLSENEVIDILNQVLKALAIVHEKGIYHLDIKPGNIMIDEAGNAVLIDFGASKQLSLKEQHETSTGMCYTPGYAPIEQVEQNLDHIGPWTDFYALGATAYKLLTGKEPPMASSINEDGEKAFRYEGVKVSDQLKNAIQAMMSPQANKRPKDATQVTHLLNSANCDNTIMAEKKVETKKEPKAGTSPVQEKTSIWSLINVATQKESETVLLPWHSKAKLWSLIIQLVGVATIWVASPFSNIQGFYSMLNCLLLAGFIVADYCIITNTNIKRLSSLAIITATSFWCFYLFYRGCFYESVPHSPDLVYVSSELLYSALLGGALVIFGNLFLYISDKKWNYFYVICFVSSLLAYIALYFFLKWNTSYGIFPYENRMEFSFIFLAVLSIVSILLRHKRASVLSMAICAFGFLLLTYLGLVLYTRDHTSVFQWIELLFWTYCAAQLIAFCIIKYHTDNNSKKVVTKDSTLPVN